MRNLQRKNLSFFVKRRYLVVLLLVYLSIIVVIYHQRGLLKFGRDFKDVSTGEITVDGDFADWSGFQPIFTDPRGDSEDPSLDIGEIFAATNGKELFIAVKTSEPLDPDSPNKSIGIDVDTNLDYQRDYGVSNELRDREERVIVEDNLMANRGEGVIEFRVPLENIEMEAEKIAINVYAVGISSHDPNQWVTCDESDWIFLRIKKEA